MAFEILDKENNAIQLDELDKQAAAFWGVDYSTSQYAKPKMHGENWFDIIGWEISHENCNRWEQVRDGLKARCGRYSDNGSEFDQYLIFFKPFLDLVKHWAELGHKPRFIK